MRPSNMVKEQCQINTAGNSRLKPWNDWAFQQGHLIEYSKCQGPLPILPPVKTLKWSTWLKPSSTAALTGKAGQGRLLFPLKSSDPTLLDGYPFESIFISHMFIRYKSIKKIKVLKRVETKN